MSAVPPTPIKTYSAEDARHGLLQSLLPIVGYPAQVWRHRYLVQNFFRRELLGRFRGSMLGIFWVLIQPIFLFVVYYLVFGYLFGNVKTGQSPDPFFAIYLFSGVLAFNALTEGLTRSCNCVVENGNLVKKVAFPSQLMPVHSILIALMVYCVGATVCFTAGVSTGVLQPGLELLLLPVVLLVQFCFTLGFGLLLANLQVFARDTSQLWGIVSMTWLFVSPVFWFPHLLEGKFGPVLSGLFTINPAYALLQAHRIALGMRDRDLDGHLIQFGSIGGHLAHAAAFALVFLAIGYSVFSSNRHKFADFV